MGAALVKDKVDVSDFSESALTKFAGNGMHLPSVGWAQLVSVLCLSEIIEVDD